MVDQPYSCVLVPGTEALKGKPGRRNQVEAASFGTEDRRCHRCLRETLSALPCEGCCYSRYCSEACRQGAREEHHRWECPVGAELAVTGLMSQLALRVALKAGWENVQRARKSVTERESYGPKLPGGVSVDASPATDEGHPSDVYVSVYRLLHHLGRQSPELRFLCAVTIATLFLMLRRAVPPPTSSALMRSDSDLDSDDGQGGVAWADRERGQLLRPQNGTLRNGLGPARGKKPQREELL
jgi:hypothetical protein